MTLIPEDDPTFDPEDDRADYNVPSEVSLPNPWADIWPESLDPEDNHAS